MKTIFILDQALINVTKASLRSEWLTHYALSFHTTLQYLSLDSEGEWVDALQNAAPQSAGIVIRPPQALLGSIALRDAISAVHVPVIEVYFEAREREGSMLTAVCKGNISGFGELGLKMALDALIHMTEEAVP